ncbi:MAG: chemotaxis protein CheW [Sulfurimonas sp.]|jgi:purine-binding chemotaxis protein CheW|nr:chemotaxis protein CheW [Sulfurimonas sp.]
MSEDKIAQNHQHLLFLVGGDLYAIKALKTSEIVEYTQITKVPMMPSFVKGVTNIRGDIVPVIDLLDRLELGVIEIGAKTSIVVIRYETTDGRWVNLGIIIDEVYEVDDISPNDIKSAPEFGAKFDKKFILNMAKYNGDYISILNTQAILDVKELSEIRV